jgi:hypothetical protein
MPGVGGNQIFFTYMKKYGLENEIVKLKYNNYPAEYYQKKLEATVKHETFTLVEPQMDWRDDLLHYASKAETGLLKVGNSV